MLQLKSTAPPGVGTPRISAQTSLKNSSTIARGPPNIPAFKIGCAMSSGSSSSVGALGTLLHRRTVAYEPRLAPTPNKQSCRHREHVDPQHDPHVEQVRTEHRLHFRMPRAASFRYSRNTLVVARDTPRGIAARTRRHSASHDERMKGSESPSWKMRAPSPSAPTPEEPARYQAVVIRSVTSPALWIARREDSQLSRIRAGAASLTRSNVERALLPA